MNTARAYLLAAGAAWGSYPVVLRALHTAPGPQLPAIFIVAARFQLTSIIFAVAASLNRRSEQRQQQHGAPTRRQGQRSFMRLVPAREEKAAALRLAAMELATIGFIGNVMSVWGLSKVSALMGEIALGTVNVFVPLLSVGIGGACAVGIRTWQGCLVSFGAVIVAAAGSGAGGAMGALGGGLPVAHLHGCAALLGAATLYALGRVRCQHHVGARGLDAFRLNALRIGLMGAFATLALLLEALRHAGACRQLLLAIGSITPTQLALLVTSCFASGFAGSSLQYRAQRTISAAASQPFFALQVHEIEISSSTRPSPSRALPPLFTPSPAFSRAAAALRVRVDVPLPRRARRSLDARRRRPHDRGRAPRLHRQERRHYGACVDLGMVSG